MGLIPDLKSWNSQTEKSLTDFGISYLGYYVDVNNIRYIMYVRVKEQYRNKGFFRLLLDEVKEGMDVVVLCNPTDLTREVSENLGYEYDDEFERMIWRK